MTDGDQAFRDYVLPWLQKHASDAVRVVEVKSHGTDWAGDTEAGFSSTFDVALIYERADGTRGWFDAQGELMGSLWNWVVQRP